MISEFLCCIGIKKDLVGTQIIENGLLLLLAPVTHSKAGTKVFPGLKRSTFTAFFLDKISGSLTEDCRHHNCLNVAVEEVLSEDLNTMLTLIHSVFLSVLQTRIPI